MLHQQSLTFEDLGIEPKHILSLTGFAEEAPEPFPQLADEIIHDAPLYCNIQSAWIQVSVENIDNKTAVVHTNHQDFHCNKIVTQQLRNSEAVIFFICSAGKGIEDWSHHYMKNGDPLKAFFIDTLGSIIVDRAMDIEQSKMAILFKESGKQITNRYSPGYCGWDVKEQEKLFTFFPNNCCGITLTESFLMSPIKSISGIIGVGEKVKNNPYTCKHCDSKNCFYRTKTPKKFID